MFSANALGQDGIPWRVHNWKLNAGTAFSLSLRKISADYAATMFEISAVDD